MLSLPMSLHALVRAALLTVLACAAFVAGPDVTYAQSMQVGILLVPALGVETAIVSVPMQLPTWDVGGLGMRVGYLEGTGVLGGAGNAVLAGHALDERGEPSVFALLPQLAPGGIIVVITPYDRLQYEVVSVRAVEDAEIAVAYPDRGNQLTLLTCDAGSYDPRRGTYTRRYVVVAAPVLP